MVKLFHLLGSIILLCIAGHINAKDDSTHSRLEDIQVYGSKDTSVVEIIENAILRLNNVPGGTNLVDMSQQRGRQLTLDDALGFEPGVTIQEFFGGNDQPRLNIRGSGIQSNPQRRGIQLLQDGLPINLADGSYIIAQLDPGASNYVEVYRGANGLRYGAASLGGAVNLVSRTGYDAAGITDIRGTVGSFDSYGGQISTGQVYGNTDYFVSVNHSRSDGYRRKQNKNKRFHISTNLGHNFSQAWASRFFFDFTRIDFDISGPLNKRQLDTDPKGLSAGLLPLPPPPPPVAGSINAGPNVFRDRPGREADILRIANKHSWQLGAETTLSLGLFYQHVDDEFTFPMGVGVRDDNSHEWGGELHLSMQRNWFNTTHLLEWGIMTHLNQTDRQYFNNRSGRKFTRYADNTLEAGNVTLFGQDQILLTDRLTLIAATQLSYAYRNIKDNFSRIAVRPRLRINPAGKSMEGNFIGNDSGREQDYFGFNPKLGLMYNLNDDTNIFVNISRSFEPPTFDELLVTKGGNPNAGPNSFQSIKLDEQTATTLEFGSRGASGLKYLYWDVTFYRSWVEGEILTTTDTFGIAGATRNSPGTTIHQGIETGLTLNINDNLHMRTSWNWSDFFFDGGLFDGKRIAGVPEHFIHAELLYQHRAGFYIGPNLKWMPAKTPTDHQNTRFQESFALLGVKAGYESTNDDWSVFIDVRNLMDKTYASSYLIRDLAPANPAATTFIPGTGLNISAGFELRF